jgi:hypothetical protein
MNDLIPFQDQQRMAESIVKSKFYGFTDINQVMAVMIVAQAENKHPGTVVQEYDIIQGRPALKSQAILARFQQAGGKVEYLTYTDEKVEMTFSHPAGGSLTLAWTMKQAASIGLATKDNWKKYPRAMLKARVVSEGVRAVYPACILGHYAVEEVMDFDSKPIRHTQVEIVQDLTDPDDDVREAWVLFIPDGNGGRKFWKDFATQEEFKAAYQELVDRYENSKKPEDEKKQKLSELWLVNEDLLTRISENGDV